MKRSLSLKQAPVVKTKLKLKYTLIAAAACGVSAMVVILLMFGDILKPEKAKAAPGMHGNKTISALNVIVNEFTTLTGDAAAGDKKLDVANSALNTNLRFPASLQPNELVMVVQTQGATINTSNTGLIPVGTQNTTSAVAGPYHPGSNNASKVQYLYTAAELTAAGLTAGNITSLQFNVTSLGTGTLSGFTISMGTTAAVALTSTFNASALTTVYTPLWGGIDAVSGWNAHNFTTLFNWNGSSNLIVQICFNASGAATTAVAQSNAVGKATYFTGANACSAPSGTLATTRPVVKFGCQVNNTLWGAITAYNNAGNFEFAEVKDVPSGTRINFKNSLKYNYSVSGKVQIIRVPRYLSLTVNAGASLTTQPWNGTTGGILAIEVNGNTVINGSLDATGLGFRGGAMETNSTENPRGNYYVSASANPYDGGEKGESIAGSQSDYDNLGGRYGRGAPANGGGSGDSHNAAGGGGANAGIGVWDGLGNPSTSTASWANAWNLESAGFSTHTSSGGGRGGYTYSQSLQNPLTLAPGNSTWGGDSRWNVGGMGGRPLTYAAGKIFLGGGGGAGDGDDNKATNGANGGGIICLLTYGAVSGSGTINANGANALASTGPTPKDAAGGGGGGGAVYIYRVSGAISGISINAKGGTGGNQNDTGSFTGEAEGPGGGGGGGYITYSNPGVPATNVTGGLFGTVNTTAMSAFSADGSTSGGPGIVTFNPPSPYSGVATLPVELVSFEGNSTGDGKVHLTWTTAAEINNNYFTLERSENAHQFLELTRVNGAGSTTNIHKYSYTDEQPLKGTSFYRLKQTDFNGTSELFNVVAVTIKDNTAKETLVRISPNPFSDSFVAEFKSSAEEAVQVSIISLNGALVYTEKISVQEGNNVYRFSAPVNFKEGTYIFRLSDNTSVLANNKIVCRKN